ncbi:MAG: thiamine pyrophosphate-dependent enzyme, partial [Defluviitaleaceae bacterium]|nr:thiamine pyrophosphate-dependent enzyme [Defluviitaleaceae bacterium]
MPKSQTIDPKTVRKPGWLHFNDISMNQYNRSIEGEKVNYSKSDFIRIYRDMKLIREFEAMLYEVKTTNAYKGMPYDNPGPAHLSLGQEASAVGQAYLLGTDDFIFGSHRSHGEIIAKGLSAIEKSGETKLNSIMESVSGGALMRAVSANQTDAKELAADFLLYGALSEIFAKKTGFNMGLGGSMHAFFIPFGIYPNNAIVGGSGTIAAGSALFKRINKKPGVVVANIGDASLGCGPVWEAMNFAAMDQIRQLWDHSRNKGLPIIFNVMNNFYGMGGQTAGETMGYGAPVRVGAGVNPEQMHAERVDGYDPLAVIDAMRRKLRVITEGRGPVLLDTVTYRTTGHSPSDSGSYRTKEETEAWLAECPVANYKRKLVEASICAESEIDSIDAHVLAKIERIFKLAADEGVSPRINLAADPDAIGSLMFSNGRLEKMAEGECETQAPKEENPRVKQIAGKSRFALDENGAPVPKNKAYQLRDGIFEAIFDKFYTDPTLVAYGEDNRDWGGAFAVYRGLTEALPYHRLFNAPISEAAIVGSAVGYAMSGGRVIAELMYCDFLGRAGDEVFNQLSKWQAMSAGQIKMPVVLRVSVGSKYGAQHSQDWTSLCAHIPGLKVVFPATPYDAKGLMNSALAGTDPVVFFESQRIYDIGEMFKPVPEGFYEVPIGVPDIKRRGGDVTVLTVGAALYRALEAADILNEKYGLSAEIID